MPAPVGLTGQSSDLVGRVMTLPYRVVRLRETFFSDTNTFLLTISKLSDMILAQSTKAQTERAESELYPREMAVGASHGTGIRLSLPSRREENESE